MFCTTSKYNMKAVKTLLSYNIPKVLPASFLGTLDMSGHFHQNNNANLQKRWCLSACKKWTQYLTSLWDIADLLLQYFENAWSYPSIMVLSPLMPKVFKSTFRKLWCLSSCKKSTPYLFFFFFAILWRHCKLVILGS